ncbi:hypothetical protein ACFL2U_01960 [Patescibacteria group bacterium]
MGMEQNPDHNPSTKSWKEQKADAAAQAPGFDPDKGIELPEDTGEAMEIVRGDDMTKEFDQTRQGAPSGEYTGEAVKGATDFGEQVGGDVGESSALEKKYEALIANPEGNTPLEKLNFLKNLYASFVRGQVDKPNVNAEFKSLARLTAIALKAEGVKTIAQYIAYTKKRENIDPADKPEMTNSAFEDLQFLQNYWEDKGEQDISTQAGQLVERFRKELFH